MLNTDRGADNYMIKFCSAPHGKSLVDVAPTRSSVPMMSELRRMSTNTPPVGTPQMTASTSNVSNYTQSPRPAQGGTQLPYTQKPHIHIAAIDNSLSFPHEHPKGWRSYTYGWLYLPVTIIGRPFSQKTRDHFLPLLTSKQWWADTTYELRKLFAVDPGFHPKMFNVRFSRCNRSIQAENGVTETISGHQRASLEYCAVFEAYGACLRSSRYLRNSCIVRRMRVRLMYSMLD